MRQSGYGDKVLWRAARYVAAVGVFSLFLAMVAQVGMLRSGTVGVAHAATLNPIQIENQKTGSPGWNAFSANSSPTALSGYAAPVSLNLGQSVKFYITTTASSVNIDVYRTGWYSGVGARLVQSLGSFPGQAQAIPKPDKVTGIIECNWQATTTLTIPTTWTSGVYLAKLTSSAGDQSFVLFVVRNDSYHSDFLVQTSITTAEAYNTYGGTSLYNNLTDGSVFSGPHATKVSFDRPFNPGDGDGAGQYLWFDYPLVRWSEAQGFDMSYTTNLDMDVSPNPLANHKVFVSVGHDEYWSKGERDNVENAIASGVNVAFFGANDAYWQIRYEPDSHGNPYRTQVGYKDYATDTTPPGPDPAWGVNNSIVTTNWRDPVVNRPENSMIGIMYEDQLSTAAAAYIVQNASNWVYANTGFTNGSSVPGIVGYEYDRVFDNGLTPAGLTVLSNSPVHGQEAGDSHSNSSIYTAPSGARVFAAGTIEWSWGLDNFGGRTTANKGIQQTTANIMYTFSGETPPPPPPPLPAGVYFADNFESGNLTLWNGPNGLGTAQAESTVVNSGSFGASISNQSGQYTYLTAQLSAPQASTYTRFYFRVASPGTATATLAQGRDATNHVLWSVTYDAGRKGIDAYFWNGAGARYDLYSPMNIVAPDAWYGMEIQANEATSGHGEVWLNGASIAHVDGDLSTSTPFSQLQLWNDAAGTVYYDDVITSNAYNGPVGGAYPAPGASLSPTALAFGGQNLGTPSTAQTVTLTNNGSQALSIASVAIGGTNPGDFSDSNACGSSLGVGASCTISVTFNPTASGTRTATLTLTDNAPSGSQSVSLSGSGVLPPPPADGVYFKDGFEGGNLTAWHAPAGIGAATVQGSVVNSGSYAAALVNQTGQYEAINADLLGGGEALTYTRLYFNVGAGASTTTLAQGRDDANEAMWVVVYDAQRHGLDAYFWNGARTRYDIYTTMNIVAPNTWYGLEVESNEVAAGHVEIWLNGASVASTDGDFSTSTPYSHLWLWNEAAGTVYYDDVIIHNAYNGPVGSGPYPAPGASLSPTSLTFSDQNIGATSAAQTVTLTNNGSLTLSIASIALGGANPGDFAQTSTCGSSLAASASCTISVNFTPTASGTRSATLTITDNAPNGSQSVTLSGTGVTAPPPPPPPPPSSGVYFQDGFESGDFSAWSPPSGSGTAAVESTAVNSGTYAASLTNASGQYESVSANLVGGGETLTYTTFAFNVASGTATTTLAQGRDAHGNLMWVVIYDAGRHGIDAYFWNDARGRFDLYSNTNLVAANTWYTLEIEFNESSTGHAEIWLNGTTIAAADGDMSSTSGYANLALVNEVTGTTYFDDVKVANVK